MDKFSKFCQKSLALSKLEKLSSVCLVVQQNGAGEYVYRCTLSFLNAVVLLDGSQQNGTCESYNYVKIVCGFSSKRQL